MRGARPAVHGAARRLRRAHGGGALRAWPCAAFSFFGFLPRDGRARRDAIAAVGACGHLALLYESPRRVPGDACPELAAALGERPAALLRELTKRFETVERGTLPELAARFAGEPPLGECVIAVLCARAPARPAAEADALDAALSALLAAGLSVRDAAAEAAKAAGTSKKTAYAPRARAAGRVSAGPCPRCIQRTAFPGKPGQGAASARAAFLFWPDGAPARAASRCPEG